MKYRVLIYRSL